MPSSRAPRPARCTGWTPAGALDRLPALVVVYGIEASSVETGDELTPEVDAAVGRVTESLREELARCTNEG